VVECKSTVTDNHIFFIFKLITQVQFISMSLIRGIKKRNGNINDLSVMLADEQ